MGSSARFCRLPPQKQETKNFKIADLCLSHNKILCDGQETEEESFLEKDGVVGVGGGALFALEAAEREEAR